jgi:hypothetical protein
VSVWNGRLVGRAMGALVFVWILVPIGGALLASLSNAPRWLPPTIAVVGFLGGAVPLFWLATGRRATLRLVDGELLLERRGQVRLRAPASGARMARWEEPRHGAIGAILHVGALRIGARDVPLAPEACDAPPGARHDVLVDEGTFLQLVAALQLRARPHATATATFTMERNTTSMRGSLWLVAPWFLTIGAASLVGVLLPVRSPIPATAIALLGLVVTIVRASHRHPARLRLEVGATHLRLLDGDVVVQETARAQLGIARHNHRHNAGRGGTYTVPVLTLTVGTTPLTIGTYDPRAAWPDAQRGAAARVLLGPPDWRRLVSVLGL